MKIKFLQVFTLAFVLVAQVSCKENKNETDAGDAENVAEASAEAQKYMVNKEESVIDWKGSKPTGTHTGTIKLESGILRLQDSTLTGSFLIDMNTINVTDLDGDMKNNLESHLKGTVEGKEDHFFNVKNYPTAAFEITGLEKKDGKWMMAGNLTIKDQKKNIQFPVSYTQDGTTLKLTSEPFTIDRTHWNVNYGSKSVFDDLGDKFVNDDIELTVKVIAERQM
ncbi:MAG: lipid-binding protein [Cytophagaceae bacterium]|nr:lipid-binding protein [Cytophagaceae bacterium]|tara:strand:- start:4466 stop:5134 length:669 start_codon:yes stop_codon:yes gene_type:complete